jgi:hypothetical protein
MHLNSYTECLRMPYKKLCLRSSENFALLVIAIGSAECAHSSSQQQQADPSFQDIPTQSWYPPSVVGSSSRPSTPTSSSASLHQRASDSPQSSSRGQPSPAEAAGIIARLKDKRLAHSLIPSSDLSLAFLHTRLSPLSHIYYVALKYFLILYYEAHALRVIPKLGHLPKLSPDL